MTGDGRRRKTLLKATAPEAGFTLIEVIIALVVTALAVTALVTAVGTGLDVGDRLEARERASLAARSLLAELGTSIPLDTPEDSPRSRATLSGQTDGGARWQAEVTRRPSSTSLIHTVDVVLTVTAGDTRVRVDTIRAVSPPAPGRRQ